MIDFIQPNWPAPNHIKAYTTTRLSGNLAAHTGDNPVTVKENRQLLITTLGLPNEPCWLNQVHGTKIIKATAEVIAADATYTNALNTVCVVLTADCLPLLICNRAGTRVAAVHAGWRGLAAGIIERTIEALGFPGNELLVWLGPAIGPQVFEVGPEVREQFVQINFQAKTAFRPSDRGRWLADIYTLARQRLATLGVTAVYGGDFCTYTNSERFFSYRRGDQTGRMASLIWMATPILSPSTARVF